MMSLKCNGVGRAKDYERSLILYFNRPPTDDELRHIHEIITGTLELLERQPITKLN